MKLRQLVIIGIIACVASPALVVAGGTKNEDRKQGGKIDEARERLDRNSKNRPADDPDDDADEPTFYEKLLLYVFAAPFCVPSSLAGDWPVPPAANHYELRAYPFAKGSAGPHRMIASVDRGREGEPVRDYRTQLRLRILAAVEAGAGSIYGQRLQVVGRTNRRLNFETDLTRYDEDLDDGRVDHLWHYKALGTYSFAVAPRVHLSAGVGARLLRFAAGDQRVHVLVRYAVELFPVSPLHLRILGEAGGNNGSTSWEYEASAGVAIHRVALFLGYRHFDLAGIAFDGPQLGLMLWW